LISFPFAKQITQNPQLGNIHLLQFRLSERTSRIA
jgi:hypothetical protein